MKNHLLTLLLGLFLYSPQLLAQKTGSFTEAITFNGEARTLNCYVPNDYDASKEYGLMIALHGLGDNSGNYSSAIFNSLNWGDAFENTIIICPDGGSDASKDFYAPEGDEAIIEEAVQFATDHYNVDESEIILQGFSLGGRSALKYGLDNPDRFKGLFLSTPAIQGVADLNNDPNVPLVSGFAYDQAHKIPIYITIGREDLTYMDVVEELEKVLIKEDAILHIDYVGGMGHTLTGATRTKLGADFIADSSPNALDVELSFMESDIQYCNGEAAPTCILRNLGSTEVTSVDLDYSLNGSKASFNWKGSLAPFQHAAVQLPAIEGNSGIQEFNVSLSAVNEVGKDDNEGNDELSDLVSISTGGMTLPYTEGFENLEGWKVAEKGNLFTWYHEPEIGRKSNGSLNSMNNILYFYTNGYTEHIYTPTLDLSSIELPSMAFDVSYNYVRYTPPFFIEQTDFADTLIVSISTDCGGTFTELFKKGGADLATFDVPMTNPSTLAQGVFTPTEGDWDRIVVELGDYKDATEAVIRFSYRSGMGGCIYVDNVRFDKALSAPELPKTTSFGMYPNPAHSELTISAEQQEGQELRIYDLTGKVMEYRTLSGSTTIDVSHLPNGYYQVELRKGNSHVRKALIIAH